MKFLGISLLLMSVCLGACATLNSENEHDPRSLRLLTKEELRSAIVGKIVTFPEGRAITGYRCYIFERGGDVLTCSGNGQALYGVIAILDNRICAGDDGTICWQFYKGDSGGYFIRHLAFTTSQAEPICKTDWMGDVEPCQLPAASRPHSVAE